MQPKIVLGISSSFCANFLKGQVGFLVSQGYSVVIISGPGEEIALLCKAEGAKLYTVDFTKRFSVFKDVFLLFEIIKILKKEKPTIINAGNPKSGFLILLAATIVGIKHRIFTLHGLLSDTKVGFQRLIITSIEKASCLMAVKVFVVSKSLLQHAILRGITTANKAICLHYGSTNGVDVTTFTNTPLALQEADAVKKEYNFAPTDFIIGFIGRISKDKGIEFLLDAFTTIKESLPQAKLVLIGPYEASDPISIYHKAQLYNGHNIFYLGKTLNVVPYYLVFNVLALTSYREGFGNVLLEAAAMQVPVIATNIPGCKDAVQDNSNGFLFEKGNRNDFLHKISQFVPPSTLAKSFGINGRNMAVTKFSNTTIWNLQKLEYEMLYKKIK